MTNLDVPIITCPTQQSWHEWLDQNHHKLDGVWLRIYKKASQLPTVTVSEALEEVLCYGWIDGIKKSYDAVSYVQKYTPRRAKSLWSKINVQHIESLMSQGRMQPTGLAAVAAAQADGRWQNAYDSPKNMSAPADFLQLLQTHSKAKTFYESLSKQNKYAISFRLHNTRKPETRQKKLQQFFEMMKEGKKFY